MTDQVTHNSFVISASIPSPLFMLQLDDFFKSVFKLSKMYRDDMVVVKVRSLACLDSCLSHCSRNESVCGSSHECGSTAVMFANSHSVLRL